MYIGSRELQVQDVV